MKLATISDAPAVLNMNDKAMWVLGFNAAVEAVDLKAWEKARFGVFHADGRFEELPVDGWEDHPLAHTARWVGGMHDMQVLRAALASARGVNGPVELDAAGQPKLPLTLLEQKAIATLNTIKAWRDSDGNEPFPDDAREGMELALMLAAARRKGVR